MTTEISAQTAVAQALAPSSGVSILAPQDTRLLNAAFLDAAGAPRVLPATEYMQFGWDKLRMFLHEQGIYVLPTYELIHWLREFIAGRPAIEIGAGNGVIAGRLGIRATDSRMQDEERWRLYYEGLGSPTVKYGAHVEKISGNEAVRRYEPEVTLACYVTHLWKPGMVDGSEMGTDEEELLKLTTYVHVGSPQGAHRNKPIRQISHSVFRVPGLISRRGCGLDDTQIEVWQRSDV